VSRRLRLRGRRGARLGARLGLRYRLRTCTDRRPRLCLGAGHCLGHRLGRCLGIRTGRGRRREERGHIESLQEPLGRSGHGLGLGCRLGGRGGLSLGESRDILEERLVRGLPEDGEKRPRDEQGQRDEPTERAVHENRLLPSREENGPL